MEPRTRKIPCLIFSFFVLLHPSSFPSLVFLSPDEAPVIHGCASRCFSPTSFHHLLFSLTSPHEKARGCHELFLEQAAPYLLPSPTFFSSFSTRKGSGRPWMVPSSKLQPNNGRARTGDKKSCNRSTAGARIPLTASCNQTVTTIFAATAVRFCYNQRGFLLRSSMVELRPCDGDGDFFVATVIVFF